jgi:hypothetical protein
MLSLSLKLVNVGSYGFPDACDGLPNICHIAKWPIVDTEFHTLDLRQSCYCESQRKRDTSICVTENINSSNQKQCSRATQDLSFLT